MKNKLNKPQGICAMRTNFSAVWRGCIRFNRPFQIFNFSQFMGHAVGFLLLSSSSLIPFALECVCLVTVEEPPFSVLQLKESCSLKRMPFPKDSHVITGGLSSLCSQPAYFSFCDTVRSLQLIYHPNP